MIIKLKSQILNKVHVQMTNNKIWFRIIPFLTTHQTLNKCGLIVLQNSHLLPKQDFHRVILTRLIRTCG
jgi:hypothetical protein